MLRDVVLHIINEQPLKADLLFEPTPGDAVLLCRNLRTMNGKKPLMADHADSTFMVPLTQVRFVEIPRRSIEAHAAEAEAEASGGGRDSHDEGPLERLARLSGRENPPEGGREPAREDRPAPPADDGPDELDDDLLRRIREV